ncbi:MAG: hypothetical protein EOO01_26950, partial [Chitinophagaceae bacterium]
VDCSNVPLLVKYTQSGKQEIVKEKQYKVKEFTYGLVKADMESPSNFQTIRVIEPLAVFPKKMTMDIVPLPAMETWVNIRDLGAKGDGETDDTQIFQNAIAAHKNIYVPQGWYRLTKTLKITFWQLCWHHLQCLVRNILIPFLHQCAAALSMPIKTRQNWVNLR